MRVCFAPGQWIPTAPLSSSSKNPAPITTCARSTRAWWAPSSWSRWPGLLQESVADVRLAQERPHQQRDFLRGGVEREMPRVEQVHLRLWHVAAVGGRLKSGSYICEEEGRPCSSTSTGASAPP